MGQYCWLAEIDGYDAASSSVKTTRITNQPQFVTQPGETPANTAYEPRLIQPALMQRDAFGALKTSGTVAIGAGTLEAKNQDGGLDDDAKRAVDGRTMLLRRAKVTGPPLAYPSGFTTALKATMQSVQNGDASVTWTLRDQQYKVQVPFQTTKYLGNNSLPDGLEGVGDLAGKPKPVLLGKVRNITPICVNSDKLIYQISDGDVTSIDAVRDGGVPLIASTSTRWNFVTSPVPSGRSVFLNGVFGGGLFTLFDELGKYYHTINGQTWFGPITIGSDVKRAWAYNGSTWLVIGDSASYSSTDGLTWSSHTAMTGASSVNRLAWSTANNLWVATGASFIKTSPDGVTWTTVDTSHTFFGITEGFGVMVAVGQGIIYTSTDCITWVQRYSDSIAYTLLDVVFTGKAFCAVGNLSVISSDGYSWTRNVDVPWGGLTLNYLMIVNGALMADAGAFGAYLSHDGLAWSHLNYPAGLTGFSPGFGGMSTNGSLIVGVMADGRAGFTITSSYGSESDLLDDDQAPAPDSYIAYLGGGYFRLGSAPVDTLTCDATADLADGFSSTISTAGKFFTNILERAGLSSSDWNAGDITALDTANSAVLGFWSGTDETTCDAVIDLVAQTVGAWWAPDALGVFLIQRLDLPSGSPVVAFAKEELLNTPFEPVPSNDANGGIPPYQTTIRGAKNYTVQTSGLALEVSAADRASFGLEWLDGISTDTSVQTRHPLSQPVVIESLFAQQADAQTEADRRQALMGADMRWFQPIVELDDTNMSIEIGDIVSITHPRYGLSSGQLFRVLGVAPDGQANRVTLSVWGPS